MAWEISHGIPHGDVDSFVDSVTSKEKNTWAPHMNRPPKQTDYMISRSGGDVHSGQLRWPWRIQIFLWYLLGKIGYFPASYVSLLEGTLSYVLGSNLFLMSVRIHSVYSFLV